MERTADPRAAPGRRGGTLALVALALVASLCVASYGAGYVFARATHEIVRYGDGHVGMPFEARFPSLWVVVYAPLSAAEEAFRAALR